MRTHISRVELVCGLARITGISISGTRAVVNVLDFNLLAGNYGCDVT